MRSFRLVVLVIRPGGERRVNADGCVHHHPDREGFCGEPEPPGEGEYVGHDLNHPLSGPGRAPEHGGEGDQREAEKAADKRDVALSLRGHLCHLFRREVNGDFLHGRLLKES